MHVIDVIRMPSTRARISLDVEELRYSRTKRLFSKGKLRTQPGDATSPCSRKKNPVEVSMRLL